MKLIDLTHKIEDLLPEYREMRKQDSLTHETKNRRLYQHRLHIDMHSGTHIDSPMHFVESKKYICDYPIESFIGEGCIIDARNEPVIKLKKNTKI